MTPTLGTLNLALALSPSPSPGTITGSALVIITDDAIDDQADDATDDVADDAADVVAASVERVVGHVAAGAGFGERALLGAAPRRASVVAESFMTAMVLTRLAVEQVVGEIGESGAVYDACYAAEEECGYRI